MLERQKARHAKLMENTFQQQRAHAWTESVNNRSKAYAEQAGPGAMRPGGARWVTLNNFKLIRYTFHWI